jgi:hypothetical protein
MAHTDHHTPAARRAAAQTRQEGRRPTSRHSLGVSLAGRGSGFHRYRDEISAEGGKTAMRRRVRRTGRQGWRAEAAAEQLAR